MLDGCYHVYLDVGSNIGVQIRKLFEPEKYPKGGIHSIFDKYFGTPKERRDEVEGRVVCAVGFEPNSYHTEYLKRVERSYNRCGWRVTFMTETGVSDHDGTSRFYTDDAYEMFEWGGGILSPDVSTIAKDNAVDKTGKPYMNVTLMRLSDFLRNVVGTTALPRQSGAHSGAHPAQIVMKVDIEASEMDVLPDLIFTGGLQFINVLMVEWHENWKSYWRGREPNDS